ncbi:MAG: hypothetical protein PHV42_04625, partial [Candidatus Pacebacteria bacterium]|nr:hypothetical protein [Candidatus Paceibacterota bacterium]
MKIALVAGGFLPIPPKGWGGVEIVVWKYYEKLTALGHEVVIFNSKDKEDIVSKINSGHFDFIHLHHDTYARYFAKHLVMPFCVTSHYGYMLKEEKWSRGFFSIFADLFLASGIIALSEEIRQKYLKTGYKNPLYVLRIGTVVNDFRLGPKGNGRALCLGKIEPRKKQAFLSSVLSGVVGIDFVGAVGDPSFKAEGSCRYLGS